MSTDVVLLLRLKAIETLGNKCNILPMQNVVAPSRDDDLSPLKECEHLGQSPE